MKKLLLIALTTVILGFCQANPYRERRQVVNAGVDAAKSAGHVAAAAGDALTLQGGKAAHQLGRAVNRAEDAVGDVGHSVYKEHPHGRTHNADVRSRRQVVNAGVDAAKSAGHAVAAAGDALTFQPHKAAHEVGRSIDRAGDAVADVGHSVYREHPHGRTQNANADVRSRRQVVNAGVDAAKSAGHVAAAAGDALTLQGGKAAHELGRAVDRAEDSVGDLGHSVYREHPHGRHQTADVRVRRQVVNAGIDAAKAVGHGVAAVGDAVTFQGDKAAHQAGRAIDRTGDAAADLGHAVYREHPHGRTGTK